MTIAIDGPVGAGKSTAAKLAAERLKIHYADTGAMYRAIAYGMTACRPPVAENEEAVRAAAEAMRIEVRYIEGVQHVSVNGEDVTEKIRTPEIAQAASRYAAYPPVREKVLSLEREIARNWDVVMDGRDIGTVVLPDADIKIYITAQPAERARRRALEMESRGEGPVDLAWMEKEIRERDERDMNRKTAPLAKAEDAVLLDTTGMSIE